MKTLIFILAVMLSGISFAESPEGTEPAPTQNSKLNIDPNVAAGRLETQAYIGAPGDDGAYCAPCNHNVIGDNKSNVVGNFADQLIEPAGAAAANATAPRDEKKSR